jgi:hypothetical protein
MFQSDGDFLAALELNIGSSMGRGFFHTKSGKRPKKSAFDSVS